MPSAEHENPALAVLSNLKSAIETDPKAVIDRLFFRTRNGAIEHVLRRLEHRFGDLGMVVRASWEESSFPGVHIELTLKDKRTGDHERRIDLTREKLWPSNDCGSDVVYQLKAIHAGAYYGGRKAKAAQVFDDELSAPDFEPWLRTLLQSVNYPFELPSHSCF